MIYERLKKLCKDNGTTITNLCVEVTGNKGNLATWKKGSIRNDYLVKISQILNVSVDYILNGVGDLGISHEELIRNKIDMLRAREFESIGDMSADILVRNQCSKDVA